MVSVHSATCSEIAHTTEDAFDYGEKQGTKTIYYPLCNALDPTKNCIGVYARWCQLGGIGSLPPRCKHDVNSMLSTSEETKTSR